MTKKELQEELKAKGIDFPDSANVAELTELLDQAQDSEDETVEDSAEEEVEEVVNVEVPKGDVTMKRNVKHNGERYEIGKSYDLSKGTKQHFANNGWI